MVDENDEKLPTGETPAERFFRGVMGLEGGFEPGADTLRRALERADVFIDRGPDDVGPDETAADRAKRLREAAVLAQTAAVTLAYEAGIWATIGKAHDAELNVGLGDDEPALKPGERLPRIR